MIKACIFDLDGVIVDTAKYHYTAWKRLANEIGLDLTLEENEQLKGVSRMQTLEIILKKGNLQDKFTPEEKVALTTRKNDWYLEFVVKMDENEVLEGVEDFLKTLQNNNIKIGLGSASKNAPKILEVTGMAKYFEVVIDGGKVKKSKPDPETFLLGAEGLGVLPSEAVVFEDSYKGLTAAINGGFYTVGIGSSEILGEAHLVLDGVKDMTLDKLHSMNI
ncbi:MAG: beta-phosphoglucomutase [Saprospiraceae bacterium]